MILVLIFAVLSVICGVLIVSAAGFSLPAALLLSVLFFFLLHVLYSLFFWAVACTVPKDKPLEKQNAILRFGAGTIVKVINFYAGVHPVITGIEKIPTDRNFLYVSNHRSMFDPLVVMGSLSEYNISFISKQKNMDIPFGGRIAWALGYLSIDRENDRNAMKTILTAADYLKRGICNIGIYPEGSRSSTNELLPFHAGSLKIAQKAKAPIVVAAGHGTEKVRRFKLFSGVKVYLDILEVIPAEKVCSMRTIELSQHIRQIIQDDLNRWDPPAERDGEAK